MILRRLLSLGLLGIVASGHTDTRRVVQTERPHASVPSSRSVSFVETSFRMSSKMKVKEGGRTVFFMLRRTAEGSNAEIMANDDGSRRVGVWSDKEEELSFRQEDPERAPTFDANRLVFSGAQMMQMRGEGDKLSDGTDTFTVVLAFTASAMAKSGASSQVLFDSGTGIQISLASGESEDPFENQLVFSAGGKKIAKEICMGRLAVFYFVVDGDAESGQFSLAIYRDGKLELDGEGTPLDVGDVSSSSTAGNIAIGCDPTGKNCFSGSISLLYLIKEAKTKEEIDTYQKEVIDSNMLAPIRKGAVCSNGITEVGEECDGSGDCSCACYKNCPLPDWFSKMEGGGKAESTGNEGKTERDKYVIDVEGLWYGATISVMCNEELGYHAIEGFPENEILTCEHGHFPPKIIVCEEVCTNSLTDHLKENDLDIAGLVVEGEVKDISKTGAQHTVVCDESRGFRSTDGREKEFVSCIDTQWTDITLKCAQDCPHYPEEEGYVTQAHGETVKHGGSIWIECAAATSKAGSRDYSPLVLPGKETLRCVNGLWTPRSLRCEQNCPTFVGPGTNYTYEDPDSTRPGTKVQLACKTDSAFFSLTKRDTDEIVCTDGEWSFKSLACKGSCTDFGNPGENYIVTPEIPSTKPATKIKVACADQTTSTTGATEEEIICTGYNWSGQTLTCEKDCDQDSRPDVSEDSGVQIQGTGNVHSSVYNATCKETYMSVTGRDTEILMCGEGRWAPKQILLDCQRPCPEYDATATPQYEVQKPSGAAPFPHGTAMKVMCAGNRTDTRGNTEMTNYCYKGNWPEPVLDCQYACPAFPDLGPGHEISGSGATHGSSRVLSCSEGYSDVANPDDSASSETVYCSFGKWGAVGVQCKASCKELDLKYPMEDKSKSETAVTHGTRKTVGCKGEDDKNEEIVCVDGKWSLHEIKCSFKGTAYPDPGPAYSYEYSNISHASLASGGDHNEVVIKCADGFNSTNPDKQEETLGFISSIGQWQDRTLICEVACPPFEQLHNFFDTTSESINPKFLIVENENDKRIVSCAAGYASTSTDDSMEYECVNGHWSMNQKFNCEPVCEPYLPPSSLYEVVPDPEGEEKKISTDLRSGASRFVQCKFSETTEPQVDKVECRNGQWTPANLECKMGCDASKYVLQLARLVTVSEGDDKNPPEVSLNSAYTLVDGNENVLIGKSAEGSYAIVGCGNGYVHTSGTGEEKVECINGHVPEVTLKCESTCPVFHSPCKHGKTCQYRVEGQGEGPGDKRTITCGSGFAPVAGPDSEEVECIDGDWTPFTIKCDALCPKFEASEGNVQVLSDVEEADIKRHGGNESAVSLLAHTKGGAVVEVGCDNTNNFGAASGIDQEELMCSHGAWSKQGVRCQKGCNDPPHFSFPLENAEDGTDTYKGQSYGSMRLGKCMEPTRTTGDFKSVLPFDTEPLYCREGKFSYPHIECAKKCEPIPRVQYEHYHLQMDENLSTDQQVVLSCSPNHYPVRGQSPEVVSCQNGTWTPIDLKCDVACDGSHTGIAAFLDTLHLDSPRFKIEAPEKPVPYGGVVNISCIEGYSDSTGETKDQLRCAAGGKYVAPSLECEAMCTELPKSDSRRVIWDTSEGSLLHGATRRIDCAFGMEAIGGPLTGSQQVVCRAGLWNSPTKACAESCDEGAHGSKMQKMCHETESSVTTPKTLDITCLDGEYPADVVECEKNCDFSQVDVPEGVMIMGDVGQGRNGQNVTAVCNDSYVSVSEMMKVESVFCWKGLWDTIELRCMRKCEKIEAPEGYVFHYEENDRTLSVHCEKGFHSPNNKHAESKQHVKCLNGKWAEIGLSCQPELILRERKLSAESSYVIWNPQREGSYDSNPHYNLFVRRPLMAFPSTPEDKVKGIGMFYSLGDFFSEDGEQPEEGPFIAAGMVVAPDSFELVWQSDEKPSRTLLEPEYTVLGEEASELLPNDHNSLTLWRGVPPKGFVCLGLVASREKHSPSKDSMRCVPNRCMHVLPKEDTELVYELTPKVRIMRPKSGPDVADDVKKLAWLHAVPFQEKEEEDFKEFRTLKLDCLHMEL